jgi:hypothetical protein
MGNGPLDFNPPLGEDKLGPWEQLELEKVKVKSTD